MTFSATYDPVVYAGNGVSTRFSTLWPFADTSHVRVEEIDEDGVATPLVFGTDYTVEETDERRGTVVATTAPASTVSWRITRRTPLLVGRDGVPDVVPPPSSGIYAFCDDAGYGPGFSEDLITAEFDELNNLVSMAGVASDGDVFVFGGSFGENPATIYTSDGTVAGCVERVSGLTNHLYAVRYADGTFIACGRRGGIARSTDAGVTWAVEMDTGANRDWLSELCTNGAGVWIATGGNHDALNTNGRFFKSTDDGLTWTAGDYGVPFGHVKALVYSSAQDRWVAMGKKAAFPNNYAQILYSDDDGATWTEASDYDGLNVNRHDDLEATFGNGTYVLTGSSYATSTDGDVWVDHGVDPFSDSGLARTMEYVNDRFVCLANGWGLQTSLTAAPDSWSVVVFIENTSGQPGGIAFG